MNKLQVHIISKDDKKDILANVIFIHGLDGGFETTWSTDGNKKLYWPLWLDKEFTKLRIYSLEYPANLTKWWSGGKGDMDLVNRANSVNNYLFACGLYDNPIIIICHSLGGILTKQMLRSAYDYGQEMGEKFITNLKEIFFFATPHNGSQLASIFNFLGPLSRPSKVTHSLDSNDSHLLDLGYWFRDNVNKLDIKCRAFAENEKTNGFFVVDPSSADPSIDGCIPTRIDANHKFICKPSDKNDPIYVNIKASINKTLGEMKKLRIIDEAIEGDIVFDIHLKIPYGTFTYQEQMKLLEELKKIVGIDGKLEVISTIAIKKKKKK